MFRKCIAYSSDLFYYMILQQLAIFIIISRNGKQLFCLKYKVMWLYEGEKKTGKKNKKKINKKKVNIKIVSKTHQNKVKILIASSSLLLILLV